MFLLYENDQEVEDSIIAYATQQNLEQLNTVNTWLCEGTFATCPPSSSSFGYCMDSLTPR